MPGIHATPSESHWLTARIRSGATARIFCAGREQIKAFLRRKWAKELDYKLKKTLWAFGENRIAVSFEYEWHDEAGQWHRSYGNELWEFDEEGLMRERRASINDAPILAEERRIL
jgi:nuclear transport factor 2 (NTF2) superfamily protein